MDIQNTVGKTIASVKVIRNGNYRPESCRVLFTDGSILEIEVGIYEWGERIELETELIQFVDEQEG